MAEFKPGRGFDERVDPGRTRFRLTPTTLSGTKTSRFSGSARLARIANHAPEVFVQLTGRNVSRGGLVKYLNYVSRDGQLALEDRDGNTLVGRSRLDELAEDWTEQAKLSRSRITASTNLSLVLAMPPPTDAALVQDAARAFARQTYQDRFDYAFVLHTDTDHPHVHLAVRADGQSGQRLNPSLADLAAWRQTFAEALRDRGVEAEATPRSLRGVTRKAEHRALRRIRLRFEAGLSEPARNLRAAYDNAAKAAFLGETELTDEEVRILEIQRQVRQGYRDQAKLLRASTDPADQTLGREVEAFVRSMPAPDSQRLAFARELRAVNERVLVRDGKAQNRSDDVAKDRER
jgi:hypothetical protein